ncbi:MAG: zinc-binding dehydrogenase [Oscillospiraceae bacterium]|nr:zinc-binding dehydrogenase [Oscillospiraceae bacterium]
MKALMKTRKGYGHVSLEDVPEPQATGDLVKIRVVYSGICGTDIHTFLGEYPGNTPPIILGHEWSGVIEAVGADVTSLSVGDRVTGETTFYICGTCMFCKQEEYNLCAHRKGIGTQVNGSFCNYLLAREAHVHKLPDSVSLLSAALSEPLACCVHGCLEKTRIEKDDIVLVLGPGAIGLLSALIAKAVGATVILAGVADDTEKLSLARELGIDRIVNQETEDMAAVVAEMTGGFGVSKVFECSGNVRALNVGLALAGRQADIVQLGIFTKPMNEIDTSGFFPRELRYIGSRTQKPSSWRKTIALMASGAVVPERLVTRIIALEEWESGFQTLMNRQGIKTVIQCSAE